MKKTLWLVIVAVGLAVPARADLQAGIALFQQGKYAEAEAALRQASGPEAAAYLAASLAKQKKYAEAEAKAKEALGANPTHPAAVAALGEALVGQRKFDEAVARMTTAIQAKPDVAYAYFWRAQAYQNMRQVARMVEDYQMFLKLAPRAPEAASVQVLLAGLK
jgi:tetratricopeptide (TPR) repeat protein